MRAAAGKAKRQSVPMAGHPAPTRVRRASLALILLALLAGHVGLALLPDGLAAARIAGLSALWWYAGLLAPLGAAAAAVLLHPAGGAPPRSEGADHR